jgi:hypothetical protein
MQYRDCVGREYNVYSSPPPYCGKNSSELGCLINITGRCDSYYRNQIIKLKNLIDETDLLEERKILWDF